MNIKSWLVPVFVSCVTSALVVAVAVVVFNNDARAYMADQMRVPSGLFGRTVMPLLFDAAFTADDYVYFMDQISVGPGHSVLEIGYGTGSMIDYYVNRTTRPHGSRSHSSIIAGFDVSPEMYAIAAARNSRAIASGAAQLHCADTQVTPLPFSSPDFAFRSDYDRYFDRIRGGSAPSSLPVHTFDLIVFNNLIDYLDDPVETLENLKILLKPDGLILSCTLSDKGRRNLMWWKKYIPRKGMDPDEHKEYFEDAEYPVAALVTDSTGEHDSIYCVLGKKTPLDDDDDD